MNYILDTNILLGIKNKAFPFEDAQNQYFWDFILALARKGYFKLPNKVIEEIRSGSDSLGRWVEAHKSDFNIAETSVMDNSSLVKTLETYDAFRETSLTNAELSYLEHCADPYVIAHAITENAVVVTAEVAGGVDKRMNVRKIKIPHICQKLKVAYISEWRFMWELGKEFMKSGPYQTL